MDPEHSARLQSPFFILFDRCPASPRRTPPEVSRSLYPLPIDPKLISDVPSEAAA
jgi:hypothetical protein